MLTQHRQNQGQRLSWDEMKRERSLGLGFSCDERYTPDHRCRKSQLLLIEGIEEEDDEIEIPPDTEEAEITLQSLTGWGSHKTNRTYTETQRRTLITLIDSGASHNFINDKTAALLNLQLTPTKPFHVRVADGFPLQCDGVYRKVQTRVDGVNFPIDLFPIPLKGLDMVIGIQWLIQLGPTLCDWEAQTLQFTQAGETKTIRGLHPINIEQAQPEEIEKETKMGHTCFAVCFETESNDDGGSVLVAMQQLLRQYDDIFWVPANLPPPRDTEHRIVLKEGSDPVNVRPYRYAHFQKEEIEKQVRGMLESGFV